MEESRYSQEQQSIHAKIVAQALAGKEAAHYPCFTVLAGPPKSGKSALCQAHYPFMLRHPESTVAIMPSAMKELPFIRDNPHLLHPEKLPQFREEYYDVCEAIAKAARERGCSVLWFEHGEIARPILRICALFDGYDKSLGGILVPDAECAAMDRIKQRQSTWREMKPAHLSHLRGAFAANWSAYNSMFDESRLFLCHPDQRGPGQFEEVARRKGSEKPQILKAEGYQVFQTLARKGMADPAFYVR